MDIKDKLLDAYSNYPLIEGHPRTLFEEAYNTISLQEEKIALILSDLSIILGNIESGVETHDLYNQLIEIEYKWRYEGD